jgi:hypothetical protein
MARNTISMRSLVKTGFGISVGMFLAQMIFVLIGMVFFIPGYIMFTKASSDKNNSNEFNGSKLGGIILMGIGVVVMGGAGFGILLDSVGDMDF